MRKTTKYGAMARDKVIFKRKSKGQGDKCFFCIEEAAIWEAQGKNGTIQCCGSKHCRKKAEKYVS